MNTESVKSPTVLESFQQASHGGFRPDDAGEAVRANGAVGVAFLPLLPARPCTPRMESARTQARLATVTPSPWGLHLSPL